MTFLPKKEFDNAQKVIIKTFTCFLSSIGWPELNYKYLIIRTSTQLFRLKCEHKYFLNLIIYFEQFISNFQLGTYFTFSDIIEDGNTHMKLLEAMKKEFKLLRILWRQIYDNVRTHHIFLRVLNFLFFIVFSRKKCLFLLT